jgi:hypothetical protein
MQQSMAKDKVAPHQQAFELGSAHVADDEAVVRMRRRGSLDALGDEVHANVRRAVEKISEVATTARDLDHARSGASVGFAVLGQSAQYHSSLPFVATVHVTLKAAVTSVSHPVGAEA